jgi:hypothetical protein
MTPHEPEPQPPAAETISEWNRRDPRRETVPDLEDLFTPPLREEE